MIKARACAGDIAAGEQLLDGILAVRLAQISRLRRGRRRACDEAADPRLSRPRRDRGRGPQHQARPRRHPRDRVLRADPAADRRRPPSRAARPRDAGDARPRLPKGGWIEQRGARRLGGGLSLPAHGRAPAADGRRRADPHAARRARRRSNALRAFSALPTATPSRRRCSAISHNVQRHYAGLFETALGGRSRARALHFPPRGRRPRDARQAGRAWAFARRWKSRHVGARWLAGELPLAAERVRARSACRTGAGAARRNLRASDNPDAALLALRPLPRRAARRRRGCFRCCGRIPTWSR